MKINQLPTESPDIQIGRLKIWISGRQFPDSSDFWDGNWLNIIANCSDQGADVSIHGPFIRIDEIEILRNEVQILNGACKGEAALPTIEPNLALSLDCNRLGQIQATCLITPDALIQSHKFIFDIDQSYLNDALLQLNRILKDYPIRNEEAENAA